MKYGFTKLIELTGFSENTIRTRLYSKKGGEYWGVELDKGHYVVSEENFVKFTWWEKHTRGKKA